MPEMVPSGSKTETINELRASGVNYDVLYIGFCPVNVSIAGMEEESRSLLLRYCISKCFALHKKEPTPPEDNVLEPMIGPPKITNKQVVLNINSRFITIIHNDPTEPEKNGKLILKYPIKYTSIIEAVDECPGSIGYISKKMTGQDRRCFVYYIRNRGLSGILQTLQDCLHICTEDEGGAAAHSPVPTPVFKTPLPPTVTPRKRPDIPPRPSASRSIVLGTRAPDLLQYPWYHGVLSRVGAEQRLKRPGEFLVRESTHMVSKLVLTCMCDRGRTMHILPVDDNGRIATSDRTFTSLEALINYYQQSHNALNYPDTPEIHLQLPVGRKDFCAVETATV